MNRLRKIYRPQGDPEPKHIRKLVNFLKCQVWNMRQIYNANLQKVVHASGLTTNCDKDDLLEQHYVSEKGFFHMESALQKISCL